MKSMLHYWFVRLCILKNTLQNFFSFTFYGLAVRLQSLTVTCIVCKSVLKLID